MADIAIYTLTSALHDEGAVDRITAEFIGGIQEALGEDTDLRGNDFSDYGKRPVDIIFVRTGGTEGLFRQLFPTLLEKGGDRFLLLASGKSNSLAASMEILSWLRSKGMKGEILHGDNVYVAGKIKSRLAVEKSRVRLSSTILGVIGKPSDWLIASESDYDEVIRKSGICLIDIPMEELISRIPSIRCDEPLPPVPAENSVKTSWSGAVRIYGALREIIDEYHLNGLTIRCFDLLSAVHNTGCLALAKLNAEGIPAGCEGDVPALLSMTVARALTLGSAFQANPSRIDAVSGKVVFAHCTVPFDMTDLYSLDTHFESGIGVGIRGHIPEGPVTVFKVSGDLSRMVAFEGSIVRNLCESDLCRTQIEVSLGSDACKYFLTSPIGNHHVIIPGHHKAALEDLIQAINS